LKTQFQALNQLGVVNPKPPTKNKRKEVKKNKNKNNKPLKKTLKPKKKTLKPKKKHFILISLFREENVYCKWKVLKIS